LFVVVISSAVRVCCAVGPNQRLLCVFAANLQNFSPPSLAGSHFSGLMKTRHFRTEWALDCFKIMEFVWESMAREEYFVSSFQQLSKFDLN